MELLGKRNLYLSEDLTREIFSYFINYKLPFKIVLFELRYLIKHLCINYKCFPKQYYRLLKQREYGNYNSGTYAKFIRSRYKHLQHEKNGYNCSWGNDNICMAYPNPTHWNIHKSKEYYHCMSFYNDLLWPVYRLPGPVTQHELIISYSDYTENVWDTYIINNPLFRNLPNIYILGYIVTGYTVGDITSILTKDGNINEYYEEPRKIRDREVVTLLLTLIHKSTLMCELVFSNKISNMRVCKRITY
jgi:hypothetical protein